MKNLFSMLLVCLILSSCQTEEFSTSESEEQNFSAAVDPTTPKNSAPGTSINTDGKAPVAGINWELIWSDEFNGTRLNPKKWIKTNSSKSRNARRDKGINTWFFRPSNTFLDGNGKLILRATKVNSNTMNCGSAETRNLFMPKYGYYEVSMKIANTSKGNHTAFWLQGPNMGNVDGTGNDGAEIDVFESAWVGNYTKSVVHIDGYGKDRQASTKRYETPGIHRGFHTYGLHWTKDFLKIYYDNELKVTYTGRWVPQVEEFLWLSVGASFGDGDFRSQPVGRLSEAEVEYIRVWQERKNNPPVTNSFRLVNKQSGRWLRTTGQDDDSAIRMANRSHIGNWTTWRIQRSIGKYFYLINNGTQKYIRPENNRVGANIILKPNTYRGSWSQWERISAGEGWFYIRNKETGKYLRPGSNSRNAPVEIGNFERSDRLLWKFEQVNR